MNTDLLPCLQCGACCYSRSERHVPVTGADWSRLAIDAESRAHFIGNRAYMRMESNHCAALAVVSSPTGPTQFVCQVYDRRPQVCRDLERASPACEAERETKVGLIGPR